MKRQRPRSILLTFSLPPFSLLAFTLLPCSLVACGGENTGGDPLTDLNRGDEALTLDGMVLHDECAAVAKDRCGSCIEHAARVQNDCRSACNVQAALSGDFAFNCASSCTETSVHDLCEYACESQDDEHQCERRAYSFEITAPVQEDNQRACEAAVTRDQECDELTVAPDCELYGRVESPKVIPVYECLAERACGTATESCMALLPQGTLVEALTAACADEIDPSLLDYLTIQQGWVHPNLQEAAEVCAERYCGTDDYEACLEAWTLATVGE
jgi:hypothetical protein